MIEAHSQGVQYGVLCDERVAQYGIVILRVPNVSLDLRDAALEFCKAQIGKPYSLDPGRSNTSTDSEKWYCSELIWASYYSCNINIEKSGIGRWISGVHPRDILENTDLEVISYALPKLKNQLVDIPYNWARADIIYCLDNGLMNGADDVLFAPEACATRAQMVVVLHRIANEPLPTSRYPTFLDVPLTQWYADAVYWARGKGIVEGYTDSAFCPLNNMPREQMALLMYRYAEAMNYDTSIGDSSYISNYTDFYDTPSGCQTAMKWAIKNGLIIGRTDTTIEPNAYATRAEMTVCLSRFAQNILQ